MKPTTLLYIRHSDSPTCEHKVLPAGSGIGLEAFHRWAELERRAATLDVSGIDWDLRICECAP